MALGTGELINKWSLEMLCGCGLMEGGGAGRDECDSLGPACHIPYLLCAVKMFVHFVFRVQ